MSETTNNVSYSEFVMALCKDGAQIRDEIGAHGAHLLHMAVGIAGELGELIKALYNEDEENILEELGDLEFYIAGMKPTTELHQVYGVGDTWLSGDTATDMLYVSGELLDCVKRHAIYGKPLDVFRLSTLLSALEYALFCVYQDTGILQAQAIQYNREKLQARYNGKYSNEAAQARIDKKEGE